MTNGEKYKTASERTKAFHKLCHSFKDCKGCPIQEPCEEQMTGSPFYWLDLEAEEEKPLPCPFCGGEVRVDNNWNETHSVSCTKPLCWYHSRCFTSKSEAVAAHNLVARAVADAKEKEATLAEREILSGGFDVTKK